VWSRNVRVYYDVISLLHVPSSQKSGVVYQISCAHCNKAYIGQIGSNLSQRIEEHKKAVVTINTDT